MNDHFLGIDLGTSSVRAGIFRGDGSQVAIASQPYGIDTPAPGYAEQDPRIWWEATGTAIRTALRAAAIEGKDLAATSFSGQMHGSVLMDRNGEPVAPTIIWADTRATDDLLALEALTPGEKFERILLNRQFPGTQAATLFWLRRHDPAVWRRIRHILLPKDYLRFRMCGLYNSEPSDASGTMLLDIKQREWSSEVLAALDIPVEFLPYVLTSHQYIAETEGIERETGIPDGIPLVTGGADQACAAFGAGILDAGDVMVAAGTGSQIVAPVIEASPPQGLTLNLFCHLPEQRWYLMGATLAGGLCLAWFRDTFCAGASYTELTAEAAKVPVGAEGLTFLPYLGGKRLPERNITAAGSFTGIRSHHRRGHFVRAIMEGIAFELRDLMGLVRADGVNPGRIVATGGLARSGLWRAMLADVFGTPVVPAPSEESSAYGAALLAGMGIDRFGSYREAAALVMPSGAAIKPDPSRMTALEPAYDRFREHREKETGA